MEQKYETDLTPKEKRQRELEKLKSLTFKGKIEYLWMYYKIWLLFLVVIIIVVNIGISIVKGKNREVFAGVGMVGSIVEDQAALEKELLEGAGGKTGAVDIYSGLSVNPDEYVSRTTLTTWIGSKVLDVLICPEAIYEDYRNQDIFVDMTEALGDSADKYADVIHGDVIILDNSEEMAKKLGITYDKVYIGIVSNGEHMEGAKALVKYLLESFYF